MPAIRGLRVLAVCIALTACLLGSLAVSANSASLSVRPNAFGDGNYSVVFSWDSGTDNGSPVVWVCVSYNGALPLSIASAVSGSQRANFIPRGAIPSGSPRIADARRLSIIRP